MDTAESLHHKDIFRHAVSAPESRVPVIRIQVKVDGDPVRKVLHPSLPELLVFRAVVIHYVHIAILVGGTGGCIFLRWTLDPEAGIDSHDPGRKLVRIVKFQFRSEQGCLHRSCLHAECPRCIEEISYELCGEPAIDIGILTEDILFQPVFIRKCVAGCPGKLYPRIIAVIGYIVDLAGSQSHCKDRQNHYIPCFHISYGFRMYIHHPGEASGNLPEALCLPQGS